MGVNGMKVCIAILAAGASLRMGRPKQILEIEGVPLVVRAVRAALESLAEEVCVVTGAAHSSVLSCLEGLPIRVVHNPRWSDGMSSSVKAAVHYAEDRDFDAVCIVAADHPFLDSDHMDSLIKAFCRFQCDAVATRCDGRAMVPCLFSRSMFAALQGLQGDKGASCLVRDPGETFDVRYVDLEGLRAAALSFDVDTPEDLVYARERVGHE